MARDNAAKAAKLAKRTKLGALRESYGEHVASANPFAPSFGVSPPALVGRDGVLSDIEEALETGVTHPDFTALLVGARGAGKTVLLNAVEDLALELGWLIIAEQGSPRGLLGRLCDGARSLLADDASGETSSRRLTGIQLGGIGATFEPANQSAESASLREVLTALADRLSARGSGLLITVDELHSADIDDVRELGGILQHVSRRERRPVAFLGAALPLIEDELFTGTVSTFIQRLARHDIGLLDSAAAFTAIDVPIRAAGGSIETGLATRAAAATGGYPFLVQLVGFHVWRAAADPRSGVTAAEVDAGIEQAHQRIGRLVVSPVWKDLSIRDREFLSAMASIPTPTVLADLARRVGVSTSYASVYKARLVRSGLVVATEDDALAFTHPAVTAWIAARSAQRSTSASDPT